MRARKKKFHEHVLKRFDKDTGGGNFFRHVSKLLGVNQPPRWSPASLYPDKSESEAAELLADYLNSISSKYEPLDESSMPRSHNRVLPVLSTEQVAKRLKESKKPTSTVPGDINPNALKLHAPLLVPPIIFIYNNITAALTWQCAWKKKMLRSY